MTLEKKRTSEWREKVENIPGDRVSDILISTIPVFSELLSRETSSQPPPEDSKQPDCYKHKITEPAKPT